MPKTDQMRRPGKSRQQGDDNAGHINLIGITEKENAKHSRAEENRLTFGKALMKNKSLCQIDNYRIQKMNGTHRSDGKVQITNIEEDRSSKRAG